MPRLKPGHTPDDEIVQGPLCPHLEHSFTSPDGQVPRYRRSGACVQCCAALTEGRLELNVQRIHEQFKGRFLEFWAMVEMSKPTECWPWHGPTQEDGSAVLSFARGRGARPRRLSVARLACYYTWGDVGQLPIVHTCDTRNCCNPLHLRVKGVAHFHHRQQLQAVRLYPQAQVLDEQIEAYMSALSEHKPKRFSRLMRSAPDLLRMREDEDGLEAPP